MSVITHLLENNSCPYPIRFHLPFEFASGITCEEDPVNGAQSNILPFSPTVAVDQPDPAQLDTRPDDDLAQYDWLIANAERRIQEAELVLAATTISGIGDRNCNVHAATNLELDQLRAQIALERQEQAKLVQQQTALLIAQGQADAERERAYRATLAHEAQQRLVATEAQMLRLQAVVDSLRAMGIIGGNA